MVSLKKGSEEKQNNKELSIHNDKLANDSPAGLLHQSLKYEVDVFAIAISLLSFSSYCLLLSKPNYIVLNEKHYIDVLQNYMSESFFLDSNPPGLSLILAPVTAFLGLDSTLTDASSHSTVLAVFYFRLVSALAASTVPTLVYFILRKLEVTTLVNALGSLLVLSNSVLLTDSRFISPNSMMIAVSLLALYFLCQTRTLHNPNIWNYLVIAFSLGISMTMLHLGFVSYLFIAGVIVYQEFQKFGDLSKSERELWKRYICVAGVVTVVPLLVYYMSYWYVVRSCDKGGVTDGYLSTPFQASLKGNLHYNLKSTDKTWILNNSNVMLYTEDPSPCYLHSHPFDYLLDDVSESLQQVTCYEAIDGNNWFTLDLVSTPASDGDERTQRIRHGDVIRIKHLLTEKYLAVYHTVESVSNEHAHLVAGRDTMSGEDMWVVEVVDEEMFSEGLWAANVTHVRFRSNVTRNYLVQTGVRLPDWGFDQMDMGGSLNAAAVWTVSLVEHSNYHVIEDIQTSDYSMFNKIAEIHKIVFVTGRYDKVKKHPYDTSPYYWLIPGLSMLYSYTNEEIIQAKTNTVLEHGMLVCLFSHLVVFTLLLVRRARDYTDVSQEIWEKLCERSVILLLGFTFHYCAFFFMQRPLFIFQFQLAYTYLIMSCISFIDLVLQHFTANLQYMLPVLAAYVTMVFVRFLKNYHFSVGYPADENEFFFLVD